MNPLDRKEMIVLLRERLAGLPLVREELSKYMKYQEDAITKAYDSAPSWEETCRLQGRRQALSEVRSQLDL